MTKNAKKKCPKVQKSFLFKGDFIVSPVLSAHAEKVVVSQVQDIFLTKDPNIKIKKNVVLRSFLCKTKF